MGDFNIGTRLPAPCQTLVNPPTKAAISAKSSTKRIPCGEVSSPNPMNHQRDLSFRFVSIPLFLLCIFTSFPRCQAQTWSTNSPLGAARWAHTATVLTDGRVLITGGTVYNVAGNFADTNSCELYDPASGTCSFTDSMAHSRHSHTATLLPDGTVLVVGGGNPSSEVYDPVSETWGQEAQLQDERLAHPAILLNNGKVLVAGGYDDNTGQELASAELYDPALGQWATTGLMPYATDSEAAALLNNGKVLVCGGSDGMGGSVTNAALYDPVGDTWSYIAPLQEARSGHTATVLTNGTVLVEGGNGGNTVEIYDPVAGTWSYAATMNDGRYQSVAVSLSDGRVMVLGDDKPDVEIYTPSLDQWDLVDSLVVPGYLQTASVLTNGDVLVTGGSESPFNGPPIATVQRYGTGSPITPTVSVTVSPTSGSVSLMVQFTSPDEDSLGDTITFWNWDFGDGATSTEQSPVHTYTTAGTFSPSLTAFGGGTALDVLGLSSITVTQITLTVSANPTAGPFPLTVQFTSPGTDSGGNTVTNWNWNFGDGSNSSAQSPSHTYLAAGNFTPTLTAYSTLTNSPLPIFGLTTIIVTNPPNPAFKTLYTFFPGFGTGPNAGLLLLDNTLYGTTSGGGSNDFGTVFSVNVDGSSFASLHSCGLNQGARPNGGLVASGSALYGTAYIGGANGGGVVFALSTNGSNYSNLYSFTFNVPSTGEEPLAGLVLGADTVYGTTEFGGNVNHGTVFSVTTNGTGLNDIHNFSTPSGQDFNLNYDGLFPMAKLLLVGPTLYGTAEGGGSFGRGTVFAMETNNPGSFRILHYFTGVDSSGTNTDGGSPFTGLTISGNTLYGIASFGGRTGNGSIFAVTTDGSAFTNLYDFTGTNDGSNPRGELVVSGNTLYGASQNGGPGTNGALFAIHTDGSGFTNIYTFSGGFDGASPGGDLVLSGNTLYGAASGGGSGQHGTVFSFTLPSTQSIPPPPLAIQTAGTNVVITWGTNAVGYGLQSSTQLVTTATWNPVSPQPVVINGKNTVTNPIVGPRLFYRLSQ